MIDICPQLVNLQESIWGSDALSFNPDRWDRLEGDAANMHAFQTFFQGPRKCPGRAFAIIEMKAVLVELVAKWSFEGIVKNPIDKNGIQDSSDEILRDGEEEIGKGIRIQNPAVTARPEGGLRIRIARL